MITSMSSAAAGFRVFSDSESAATPYLSPSTSLAGFFERYFVPSFLRPKRRDSKTLAEYRTAIDLWVELTGDPPLCRIDAATCARFVDLDLSREGRRGEALSPNTVRKHCTHLQMVLDLAGPQTRDRPEAATEDGLYGLSPRGWPRRVPWLVKPEPRDKPPEDCFSLAEISAWLAACERATAPNLAECSAPVWWRGVIRAAYNVDLRRGSLLAMRRTWITPIGMDEGLLEIPGKFYKGGRPHQFYLSPAAMGAIGSMPTGDLIFPWPFTLKHLGTIRKKLLKAAGIPKERWFGFHAIRKCGLSEIAILDPDAARTQAGHSSLETTIRHYLRPSARGQVLANRLGPIFAKLPQP